MGGQAIPAAAEPFTLQLTSGYDFSSGRYGASTRTDLQTASVTANLRYDGWSLRAYVPFLAIRGPASVVVIGGSAGAGSGSGSSSSGSSGSSGESAEDNELALSPELLSEDPVAQAMIHEAIAAALSPASQTRTGLGDVTLTLNRTWTDILHSGLYAVAGGFVRLPTGNYTDGLGVGAVDFGAQSEVGIDFGGTGLYGNFGRRFRGNRAGSHFRLDGWQASGGGWINAGSALQLGAYYDWRERTAIGLDAQQDAGAYLRYAISKPLAVQLYAEKGFSSASPAFTAGVRLSYTL